MTDDAIPPSEAMFDAISTALRECAEGRREEVPLGSAECAAILLVIRRYREGLTSAKQNVQHHKARAGRLQQRLQDDLAQLRRDLEYLSGRAQKLDAALKAGG